MNINDFAENNKELNIQKLSKVTMPVIYFICKNPGNKIIYIGKSENLYGRISLHLQRLEFNNCSIYYFSCSQKEYILKEKLLIKNIQPKYNIKHTKNDHKNNNHSMKSQLDKEKLDRLLKIHKKKYPWLANNLNWTRQRLYYHLKKRTVMLADVCAPLFGLKGKDLIK